MKPIEKTIEKPEPINKLRATTTLLIDGPVELQTKRDKENRPFTILSIFGRDIFAKNPHCFDDGVFSKMNIEVNFGKDKIFLGGILSAN